MKTRTNAGYTIIAAIQFPDYEYVLGKNKRKAKNPNTLLGIAQTVKIITTGITPTVKIKPRTIFTNAQEKKLITVCKN